MKLTTAAVLALLEWKLAGAHPAIGLPPGGLPRPKPQPTGTGDPGPGPGPVAHDHDRGTFNMDCSKAGAACNNACWSIYCLQQDTRKQIFGGDNAHNRKQSGCNAPNSVCTYYTPFSQKLTDPQGRMIKPTCDEWPMADTKQDDYGAPNRRPNSLRCIPISDNASGGSQYSDFVNFKGNYPGRKGTDAFQPGDFWQIAFDSPDDQKSPYCMPNPKCDNDGFQFEMTKFIQPSGKITAPSQGYNYDTDNRYALNGAGNGVDIVLCSVHLKRTKENTVLSHDAQVFDYKGKQKGQRSGSPTASSPMEIDGLPGGQIVTITPNSDTDNDVTHDTNYEVGGGGAAVFWTSSFVGAGDNGYCVIEEIDNGAQSKDETCHFPCFIS